MEPVATIVIPTRNRPDLLRLAVDSALVQTVPVEVIVVDEASTPPVSASDERVRVVRHDTPGGPSAARNAGLAQARAPWITFLDDDDTLMPAMVERAVAAIEASARPACAAALSGVRIVRPDGTSSERRPRPLDAGDGVIEQGTVNPTQNTLLVATEVMRTVGGFDPAMTSAEHTDLLLRITAAHSIEAVAAVGYRWLDHGGERLHRDTKAHADAMRRTIAKHQARYRRHPRAHARRLAHLGRYELAAGRRMRAATTTARSLLIDPRQRRTYLWLLDSLMPRTKTKI